MNKEKYLLATYIFLRFLSVIYLIAFISLWIQLDGLIGSNGILPVSNFLYSVYQEAGANQYFSVPTLCWLNSSDWFLHFLCALGVLSSILLLFNIAPSLNLFLLWIFYLSLASVSGVFLSFQWDNLLLEVGFLAIFIAPNKLLPGFLFSSRPHKLVLWLMWILLFKLMFFSGFVKLKSGDVTWQNLTALTYHYETQPLTNFVAYYVHWMPLWFHKVSCFFMFLIELVVPFMVFGPRNFKVSAAIVFVLFQSIIILTGNYCFFNLLAIALCLLLLDDRAFQMLVPKAMSLQEFVLQKDYPWSKWIIIPLSVLVLSVTIIQFSWLLRLNINWPRPIVKLYSYIQPFRSINNYGLFAVMTKERPEIIVEGSNNGKEWYAYEFKYKAGNTKRMPGFVAPHQPRLDWQMWFAALGDFRHNSWFINFCIRLLQGSPQVIRLLDKNPFPGLPPRYIRAVVYDYKFTNPTLKKQTKSWWQRKELGLYCPVLSLSEN